MVRAAITIFISEPPRLLDKMHAKPPLGAPRTVACRSSHQRETNGSVRPHGVETKFQDPHKSSCQVWGGRARGVAEDMIVKDDAMFTPKPTCHNIGGGGVYFLGSFLVAPHPRTLCA